MEKISLDTRIQRVRSGVCSSPEHILPGLRAYADLPVNAVLSLFFPDLQMKFSNYVSTLTIFATESTAARRQTA